MPRTILFSASDQGMFNLFVIYHRFVVWQLADFLLQKMIPANWPGSRHIPQHGVFLSRILSVCLSHYFYSFYSRAHSCLYADHINPGRQF